MRTLSRLNLCALLCLSPTLPIFARLVTLQVLEHGSLTTRVQNETDRFTVEIIPRGRILDRNGLLLAESLPAWSCFVDIKAVKDPQKLARTLAPILGLKSSEIYARMNSEHRTAWLMKKLSFEQMSALKALRLAAIGLAPDERRFYPNGDLARDVLGSVNADGKGVSGIELAYEQSLGARSLKIPLTRDASGKALLKEPQVQLPTPPDVKLTLDRAIQYFAETAITETVLRYHAKRGVVVIQDPKSGDLLAVASYPVDPMHNAIIQDVYEPGSTFKLVTAAAALERKTLGPEETIDCEGGRWRLTEKVTIKDHEPQGALTLAGILQHSSNIGAGKIALRLGASTFAHYCHVFGFGDRTGLQFPAESGGLLNVLSGSVVRLANAAFGQGLAVTPLQLVGAYSAVANGGTLLEPRLVAAVGTEPASGPIQVRRVVSAETARALQGMLELIVEKGTGMSAAVGGYSVAGKTGTAQKLDPATGKYSTTNYVSSFAGYAPADDPQFTILVAVDSPAGQYYGAEVAAPVFARLTKEILALRAIPPRKSLPVKASHYES